MAKSSPATGPHTDHPGVNHPTSPFAALTEPSRVSPPALRGDLSFLEPPQSPGELGRLGRFRVLEVLGIGGMGIVLRAHDPDLRREIALKVMRAEFADNPAARERFLNEARAMAAVKDDHVITIHDVGTINAMPFMAMELLHGQALHHRLERCQRLPWPEVVQIGIETARGLAAAHARGLIHRDIKPSNLFLEERPGAGPVEWRERVMILDFGLVREIACDQSLSPEGTVMGTPAYMAPEQARGEPVDGRTDLFSLGCVLYELVTGRKPFEGRDAFQILLQIANHQPTPPLRLNQEMPGTLSRLIEEMLAKERDQRPASAPEVISRLLAIDLETGPAVANANHASLPALPQREVPTPFPDAPTVNVAPTRSGNRRWWLALAGLGVITLAGLAAWGLGFGRQPAGELPLRGELIVRVRTQANHKPEAQIGVDPLAVPVREDELLQLEARLNQPAYVYLLWVDGKGEVTPLYPWNPDGKLIHKTLAAPPPAQKPEAVVRNPRRESKWWPIDDTEGLDTMLLLARKSPLPVAISLADLVGCLPEAPLGPRNELVMRGMNRGLPLEKAGLGEYRRPKAEAAELENQLLNLMDRLKDHFELIRAVQFAHVKK